MSTPRPSLAAMRIIGIDPASDLGLCSLGQKSFVRLIPAAIRLEKRSAGKHRRKKKKAGAAEPKKKPSAMVERRSMDAKALRAALVELRPQLVIVEKVGAMPGQGSVATFTFGTTYGTILGVLVGLGIQYVVVTPQRWKKVILVDYDLTGATHKIRRQKNKDAAIDWVKKNYPAFNLIPPGCRSENDNMADAVALAHYAKINEGLISSEGDWRHGA